MDFVMIDVKELLYTATIAKKMLVGGHISYDEAKRRIQPYIDYFNKVSIEKARLFNQKPYKITVSGFLR